MPSLARGYVRLALSLFSLVGGFFERDSQWSFGYEDFLMLTHRKRDIAVVRENFFKLLLVKTDDQCLDDRPKSLIIVLRHKLLVGEEDSPQRSYHLVFHGLFD